MEAYERYLVLRKEKSREPQFSFWDSYHKDLLSLLRNDNADNITGKELLQLVPSGNACPPADVEEILRGSGLTLADVRGDATALAYILTARVPENFGDLLASFAASVVGGSLLATGKEKVK